MRDSPIETERFDHFGRAFEVSLYADYSHGAPWDEEDGHGPVRHIPYSESMAPGETFLAHGSARGYRYVYGFGAALVQASREGWGIGPRELELLTMRIGKKPTRAQIRAESVRQDMKHLAGWCDSDWQYIGVSVRIIGADDEPEGHKFENALWGVESSGDYWREVARELADEILAPRREAWRAALRHARESREMRRLCVVLAGPAGPMSVAPVQPGLF